jgi:hypothetical protein
METSRKAVALAGVVVAAALVTGTWAYTNFDQAEINELDGQSSPGVRLHDDFTKVTDAKQGVEENKDVYVENYGDHPQFVRIKLSEFMSRNQEDTDVVPAGASINDVKTWFVHTAVGTDEAKHAAPDGDTFHTWWTWGLGGQKYYQKTTNKNDDSNDVDSHPADVSGPVSDTVGQTLVGQVKTMAEWLALTDDEARKAYVGWVWDTDGWVYWVGALAPGDATGLLLSSVTMTQAPESTVYKYRVNVAMQAATSEDIGQFATTEHGGMTSAAAAMLNLYAPKAPAIKLGMARQTVSATTGTALSIDLATYISDPNYGDTVTYHIVSTTLTGSAPTLDADGHTLKYTPVAGDEGKNYTIVVNATDQGNLTSPNVTITLDVQPASA